MTSLLATRTDFLITNDAPCALLPQVYKPIVHVDEIGLTSDKYVPLNESLSSLPLRVTIEPMSMQRWQLMQVCFVRQFWPDSCSRECLPTTICLR